MMTVQTNQLRKGDKVRVGPRRIREVASDPRPNYATRTVGIDWLTPGGYYAGTGNYPETENWEVVR